MYPTPAGRCSECRPPLRVFFLSTDVARPCFVLADRVGAAIASSRSAWMLYHPRAGFFTEPCARSLALARTRTRTRARTTLRPAHAYPSSPGVRAGNACQRDDRLLILYAPLRAVRLRALEPRRRRGGLRTVPASHNIPLPESLGACACALAVKTRPTAGALWRRSSTRFHFTDSLACS